MNAREQRAAEDRAVLAARKAADDAILNRAPRPRPRPIVLAVDLHCTRCGALPDEPCRQTDSKSVPPHPERRAAEAAANQGRS